MRHFCSVRGSKKLLVLIGAVCLLIFFPALTLSACEVNGNISCTGININCTYPTATPNLPSIMATAHSLAKSKPVLVDSLQKQDINNWDESDNCYFKNGNYVASVNPDSSGLFGCGSTSRNYTNVAVKVNMTLISGYGAGIFIRLSSDESEAYAFEITNAGQFEVILGTGPNNPVQYLVPETASKAIRPVGRQNTLLVIANRGDFQFLVNGVFVTETHDNTLASGGIGFSLSTYSTGTSTASFSHLVVYSI